MKPSETNHLPTQLEGRRIRIRRLRLSDAQGVYRNCKTRDAARWNNLPHPYPQDEVAKFIRQKHRQWRQQKGFIFGIVHIETNTVIGDVGLINVDFKHKTAEMGFLVNKKHWNQGYATEAAQLVLKFAFEWLKLYRVYAHAFEPNIASWRVMEKCGLIREGVQRQARVKHNKRQNLVCYAILKPDYDKKYRS